MKIAQNSDNKFTSGKYGSYNAYGVTGSSFKIYLNLWDNGINTAEGWDIISDTWGKKDKEKVDGVSTEPVATGTLIIRTSKDGKDWKNADKDRYAKGIYTTDYYTYYGNRGDVEIYTPSGADISDGLYLQVLYAYQVQKDGKKSSNTRYLEKYEFYICNDNLGAITIHNLSVTDASLKETIGDDNDQTIEIGIHMETLTDGSETVTGFKLDTSLNEAAKVSVKKDGVDVVIPNNKTFTDTGKYDISIASPIGTTDHKTIYVDTTDIELVKARYFGECFITGKRIFEEGLFPVYEGGKTEWNIMAVDDTFLPLQGTITNTTTGDVITIEATRSSKTGVLSKPGEYEAVLSTNPEYDSNKQSGDIRRFTFRFRIIEEGTAPGPVVNKESLLNYAKSNVADIYPVYYGLTYSSASKGYITLLFKDQKDALEYARNYESGMVEEQDDGTYRYNGSFYVSQKELYESNWDLMDAVDYFANLAVQELYIDITDEFTYVTLPDNEKLKKNGFQTDNYRQYELNRSVYVFADDVQKEKLTDLEALPIINDKHYFIQWPNREGKDGSYDDDVQDFEFVKDKYGCDSDSIKITDAEGSSYKVEYGKSVGDQLKSQGCPSGIITIEESTVYGDSTSYQAIYIAEGENHADITVEYYLNGEKSERNININDCSDDVICGAFGISSIVDDLDPYDLIIISMPDGKKKPFVADQVIKDIWTDEGKYNVKVINRLGYGFDFNVEVTESEITVITFSGEGTEQMKDMLVLEDASRVTLPKPERYGYEFLGYVDSYGNEYKDEIEISELGSKIELEALWMPEEYNVTFYNEDDTVLHEHPVTFGETYSLPTPSVMENEEFLGWIRSSDRKQFSDEYVVDIAGDQTFTPLINRIVSEEQEETIETSEEVIEGEEIIEGREENKTEVMDSQSDDTFGKAFWIFVLAGGIVIIAGIIVGIILATRSAKRKNVRK